MKQRTFEDIYTMGDIVKEDAIYRHYHDPAMLVRYDSNFIEFKRMPSLDEFLTAEKYLRNFHRQRGQQHVKFTFPADCRLPGELSDYLDHNGYDTGFLELYAVQPGHFPEVPDHPDMEVREVTAESLDELLALRHRSDLEFGSEFADQKAKLIKRQFADPEIMQLIAFYRGEPAGFTDVILADETAEIDNLSVEEKFRNKGIASRLQKFVMETVPEKTVILVADGEDTPRDMYLKQNYQCLGFKYETVKVFRDEEA